MPRGKRVMSQEARDRISRAMKLRWAQRKGKPKEKVVHSDNGLGGNLVSQMLATMEKEYDRLGRAIEALKKVG